VDIVLAAPRSYGEEQVIRGGGAVRDTSGRMRPAVALFSRRHIDFARTAGALCPGA
jgi:hypothetical protein